MRPALEIEKVISLRRQGLTVSEVSRLTQIPRSTVRDWAFGQVPGKQRRQASCPTCNPCVRLPHAEYAYLLGLYLGDGYISEEPRTYRLRIAMDAAHPRIIEDCRNAMEAVSPGKRASTRQRKNERCTELSIYWNHWPCLFPQVGPGRKHEREIQLADWQKDIASGNAESLIKGLVESDGCRIVASDRGRLSVRYHFKNNSEDIKRIYCDALDRLNIPWTRPCSQQIAVYWKAAAARMDGFIGPKS